MAMQMQALVANPIGAFTNGSRMTRVVYPVGFTPRMGKRVTFGVKCMAEDKTEGEPKLNIDATSSNATPTMPSSPAPTPKPKPTKVSTKFSDVFAFSGPAPERINGRLAMIGFVAAVAVELSKGTDLFSQISDGGAQWFLGTSILLSGASLVPLFKGERAESKTDGLMNANAELWNGRVAMLGLMALAFTEFVKGGALV
ncbi:early light-induced protein 1, chloroplastic-like [Amaranthus tricolor]|uniref:early light-induced protein 1, chloroplastic-like n=1 Tax=Amaranthus tricolor TaxID=29722 RepID=UPI002589C929|nr:early light-induced protein 1, chloroplastic-like [Amaranthus tricolor]